MRDGHGAVVGFGCRSVGWLDKVRDLREDVAPTDWRGALCNHYVQFVVLSTGVQHDRYEQDGLNGLIDRRLGQISRPRARPSQTSLTSLREPHAVDDTSVPSRPAASHPNG